MKGYKAFEKGMICRGKQYAENTVFEEESAEICKSGMHFVSADNPLEVISYYPLVDENGNESEFAEVEALDEPVTDDNKKYCSKKLKIGGKISFAKLVQAAVNIEREKTVSENECSSGNGAIIGSSGDWAIIGSSGDWAQIGSSGDWARIGSSGGWAIIGSSGYGARIGSSGNGAQIGSSGDGARICSSGYGARIGSSGYGARIGSSGDGARIGSSGENCVICCAGHNSFVKAKKGSWITLAEWDYSGKKPIPVCVKTERVDGEKVKADTFYTLKNGEFVEAEKE